MFVCRDFANCGNPLKTVALLLQGGGRWFEPSIAHFGLFYVHVYETGGYMLKIDGAVPKSTADSFGEVLESAT
jgi:hypothetical protein